MPPTSAARWKTSSGPASREHPRRVLHRRQVVVRAARDDDVVAVALEPLDEVGAEEAPAAGDQDRARPAGYRAVRLPPSASTMPREVGRRSARRARRSCASCSPSPRSISGSRRRTRPGYHRDEAALSLNAYTLSTDLRDEDGARLPLFFRSFDDYKSPLYPYLLAGVFERHRAGRPGRARALCGARARRRASARRCSRDD